MKQEQEQTKVHTLNHDHKFILQKLNKELAALYTHNAKYNVNGDGSVTFWPTPNCKPAIKPVTTKRMSMKKYAEWQQCKELEASSNTDLDIAGESGICSFITAAIDSWSSHYPIRFKPEHIWLLILQGVAVHVDRNAEKLRTKYVNHKETMTLRVERDDFVLGSAKNDWEGVIEEFVEQIDSNTVKDTVQLFDCDFSGSTMMDKICTKVTIMDICKNYFNYMVCSMCGFPQITLDGTRSDWIRLKQKTSYLLKNKVDEQFGAQWSESLLPLLDRFIGAFDGEIDCLFWNSMIKRGARYGSGGFSWFSGWINILFPFMSGDGGNARNQYCVPYSEGRAYVAQGLNSYDGRQQTYRSLYGQWGIQQRYQHGSGGKQTGGKVHEYPSGLAQAPVVWKYQGQQIEMKFIAGFVGYQQDPKSLEICPNLSWCITR